MSLTVKILMLVMMFVIVASLGLGLYYLICDSGKTKKMANALRIRIILSLLLFILLWIGVFYGWIKPHGLQFWL